MTPFESARTLGRAARALRGAIAAAYGAAELAGLEVPRDLSATALTAWLDARAAVFATQGRIAGVDPFDARYRRSWGVDRDAIRADLRTAGLVPCDAWDCVEVGVADVRWRRTWPGGSFESASRYCARHLAELRARSAAGADPRLVLLDEEPIVRAESVEPSLPISTAVSERNPEPTTGQLDLLAALVHTEASR